MAIICDKCNSRIKEEYYELRQSDKPNFIQHFHKNCLKIVDVTIVTLNETPQYNEELRIKAQNELARLKLKKEK